MSHCLLRNTATILEESSSMRVQAKKSREKATTKSLPCEFLVTVLLVKGKNQPNKVSMELKERLVIGSIPSLATLRYNTNLQPS